jgi:hypothetical protein
MITGTLAEQKEESYGDRSRVARVHDLARRTTVGIYFSDHFGVDPDSLRRYGALDICVVTDIPVFIDPFLIFNSSKPEYQELHQSILRYLTFLRDKSQAYVDPYLGVHSGVGVTCGGVVA